MKRHILKCQVLKYHDLKCHVRECEVKTHGLWVFNLKNREIFTKGLQGANFLYFFGPESYNAIWN